MRTMGGRCCGGCRSGRWRAAGLLVALALAGCAAPAPPTPLTVPHAGSAMPPPAAGPAIELASACVEAVPREVPIYLPSGTYHVRLGSAGGTGAPEGCPTR